MLALPKTGGDVGLPVRIRLMRVGARNNPRFRLVVADSKMPRNGRFIEIVGYYNPTADPAEVQIKSERVIHWLELGAQPTETVLSLLKQKGIWQEFEKRHAERLRKRKEKEKARRKAKKTK
ncbi:MAG: 30S ribosomal protein S16 [Armatimonadota bacterium]|nr:30S ribosomal protein S16 [Armatimonadota bacterium]MCX7777328.1 30S ribosomal protein S16 [Armatimonadota bacterium]MDW8024354.1 30S ribosomal protein S16 [Armatimonadota bacterium]